MNYNYGMPPLGGLDNINIGNIIWLVISVILALVGCFMAYFLLIKKDIKTEDKRIIWLKEFLSFDKMLIEPILKIAYVFTAIFITLSSFSLIGSNFLSFLATLIFGNLIARVSYEAMLIMVMLWKNTTEIKNKINKK